MPALDLGKCDEIDKGNIKQRIMVWSWNISDAINFINIDLKIQFKYTKGH